MNKQKQQELKNDNWRERLKEMDSRNCIDFFHVCNFIEELLEQERKEAKIGVLEETMEMMLWAETDYVEYDYFEYLISEINQNNK